MKTALQFSGGKDSVVCLWLLKPIWDDITVYWLNSGNAFPEVILYMEELRKLVPHFVEVRADQPQVIRLYGLPTEETKFRCCEATLWFPMHIQMLHDGVDLIIRGQKNSDHLKSPIRSGHFEDGIKYWFPLESWTDQQVWDYIKEHELPVAPFYGHATGTLECMNCTAYADLKHSAYMEYRNGTIR